MAHEKKNLIPPSHEKLYNSGDKKNGFDLESPSFCVYGRESLGFTATNLCQGSVAPYDTENPSIHIIVNANINKSPTFNFNTIPTEITLLPYTNTNKNHTTSTQNF